MFYFFIHAQGVSVITYDSFIGTRFCIMLIKVPLKIATCLSTSLISSAFSPDEVSIHSVVVPHCSSVMWMIINGYIELSKYRLMMMMMMMNQANGLVYQLTDAVHNCMLKYHAWTLLLMLCHFYIKFAFDCQY